MTTATDLTPHKTRIFTVSVRHNDGSNNLYHVAADHIKTWEDAVAAVRDEIDNPRLILVNVSPTLQ
jgi:hypothetical protein